MNKENLMELQKRVNEAKEQKYASLHISKGKGRRRRTSWVNLTWINTDGTFTIWSGRCRKSPEKKLIVELLDVSVELMKNGFYLEERRLYE